MKTFSLSEQCRADLRANFAQVKLNHDNHHHTLAGLYKAFSSLPEELLSEIFMFGRDVGSPGVMLIEGLPIDQNLPATPTGSGKAQIGEVVPDAEKSLLGLAQLMGTPVGYLSEKEGHLIHHVVPMAGGEYTQSNRGSKVFLSFHNDSMYDDSMIFNSHNPDYLLLLCLRSDPEQSAKTLYIDAREIVDNLDPAQVEILRQPRFKMAAPSNYTLLIRTAGENEKVWSNPVPILSGPVEYPEIYLAANGVEGLDADAVQALKALTELCQQLGETRYVKLQPGQALLINNRKGVHARTRFAAHYDGQDRWLLRANIRTSIWDIRDRATEKSLVFA